MLLAFAVFAMPTHARPPDPYEMPVQVVNTPDVNVVKMPNEVEIKKESGNDIRVDVGEPTVHIGSMPPAEREPFTNYRVIGHTGNPGGTTLIYTVPEDKNLVIEFISVGVELQPNQRVREFYVEKKVDTTVTAQYYTPPLAFVYDDGTAVHYRGSQKVLIHAGAGEPVHVGYS